MATTTLTPQAATYRRSWILEWLTTVDHKKIGIMYIANSFFFFFLAGIHAALVGVLTRAWHGPVADRPDPGRDGLDPGLGQLHRHHLQDAGTGNDPLPDADLRVDRAGHDDADPARHAGADRGADRAL